MEDMFITPIQPWSRVGDAAASGQTSASSQSLKGQDGVSAFKSIFEEAINNVRETDQNLAKNQYLLATGQIEDPHTVGIAASQAQLSIDLLAALRTKALEAYNEIMRLSL
ncbi:flagellar hook-basal body complex protein FliE [Schaedlerella arabinosiphila]|uniref:Flagellar hook-basal body complex protein FliE n=2 Tax=Schaedlerella arabinosiphila TaxID=2044587 RepID=A0A9X5H670_9FIRM|nr:flagellar hook-basal body complex protein FliE [Schaedlerella arabinosiphila]KAI4441795.1 Flagellar hook-basal body complex protein FliE [Schaedlerella arabinosiphila]NDO68740.1 flagellar hook-basal body complex protein FliE [Schaedlerella arabinosiphila]